MTVDLCQVYVHSGVTKSPPQKLPETLGAPAYSGPGPAPVGDPVRDHLSDVILVVTCHHIPMTVDLCQVYVHSEVTKSVPQNIDFFFRGPTFLWSAL